MVGIRLTTLPTLHALLLLEKNTHCLISKHQQDWSRVSKLEGSGRRSVQSFTFRSLSEGFRLESPFSEHPNKFLKQSTNEKDVMLSYMFNNALQRVLEPVVESKQLKQIKNRPTNQVIWSRPSNNFLGVSHVSRSISSWSAPIILHGENVAYKILESWSFRYLGIKTEIFRQSNLESWECFVDSILKGASSWCNRMI